MSESRNGIHGVDFNNLEEIDSLIERLSARSTKSVDNPRLNRALEENRKKISQLKDLKKQLERKRNEEREAQLIEKQNRELDEAIARMSSVVNSSTSVEEPVVFVPRPTYHQNSQPYYSGGNYDSSESRDGESRY